MSKAAAASSTGLVRLHLTPFSPALFQTLLPKSQQSLATSISYHKVQSDPDKGFGYLELPTAEAEKLQNKLNGAILRGQKMSVEKARPEKRKAPDGEPEITAPEPPKKKKSKKSKRDEIAGFELPADRKVKRGWTDSTIKRGDEKKKSGVHREKSKYSDKDEVLFRAGGVKTKKPKADDKSETKDKKDKKSKTKSDKPVIHEFEKTNKFPTFLKQAQSERSGGPLTYVDGEGWVDEAGNVVEAVKSTRPRPAPAAPPAAATANKKPAVKPEAREDSSDDEDSESEVSSDDTSSEESESEEDSVSDSESDAESQPDTLEAPAKPTTTAAPQPDPSDSDSDPSSDSDTDSSASDTASSPVTTTTPLTALPQSATSPPKISVTSTSPSATPEPATIHPLEALYKRPAPTTATPRLAIQTNFSFFGGGDDDAEEAPTAAAQGVPATPFTATDLRLRGLRSAAPTPDTAFPGRPGWAGDAMDLDDDAEADGYAQDHAGETVSGKMAEKVSAGERSAFVNKFYEQRKEMNAAYKAVRRETKRAERSRGEKKR